MVFVNINAVIITYYQDLHQLIIVFTLHPECAQLDRQGLHFPCQIHISGSGDVSDLLQLVVLGLEGFKICRQLLQLHMWKENSWGTLADAR